MSFDSASPAPAGCPAGLAAVWSALAPVEAAAARLLLAAGQQHLFSAWPPALAPGADVSAAAANPRRLLAQAAAIDSALAGTGGLAGYLSRARSLLADARAGANPFEGCVPSVPEGETLSFGSAPFCAAEAAGLQEVAAAAFVLVAGGLGERLGYSGIKLALPVESATGASFLRTYCESIAALQARTPNPHVPLPLAIMTSGDTHAATLALLEQNGHFGLAPGQVTCLQQAKVPCLADGDARLAVEKGDPYCLMTKPHGHGDVHALLHASGLAARWLAEGRLWAVFFQDTNGLVFKAIPAALGVSAACKFDVNSLAVPRRAGEAIGGLARLARPDGTAVTVNVEYNQLDPLLRASGWAGGDANDPATGYSPFPGNINQLVLALGPYVAQLAATGGQFVNPKYADASRAAFKSPTRLECMMQDWAKTVPPHTRVGFTSIAEVWAGYSPVKNSAPDAVAKVASGCPPHSAASGELDAYGFYARALRLAGCDIAGPTPCAFAGTALELWPRCVVHPSTAASYTELRDRVARPWPTGVHVSGRSVLLLSGDVRLEELRLDGALTVEAAAGATVHVRGLRVSNAGWEWRPLGAAAAAGAAAGAGGEAAGGGGGGGGAGEAAVAAAAPSEEEAMRGFTVVRHATAVFVFSSPGEHVLSS